MDANFKRVLVSLLAVSGMFAVAFPAAAVAEQDYCSKGSCIAPDTMGGFGLLPKRSYTIAYGNGSALCQALASNLNKTLKMDRDEALRRVTHPIPGNSSRSFQSQNPLFGGPGFMQWNYLDGYPDDPDAIDNYNSSSARWLIVSILNDDRPYLITGEPGWGMWPPNEEGSVDYIMWNISPKELAESDWSKISSYKSLPSYRTIDTNGARKIYNFDGFPDSSSPLDIIYVGTKREFPALPKKIAADLPWKIGERKYHPINFFYFQKQYFFVIDGWPDLIIVGDASLPAGRQDICYLSSGISIPLYQQSIATTARP